MNSEPVDKRQIASLVFNLEHNMISGLKAMEIINKWITKAQTEARIDEVIRFRDDWGYGTGNDDWERYAEKRLAELNKGVDNEFK